MNRNQLLFQIYNGAFYSDVKEENITRKTVLENEHEEINEVVILGVLFFERVYKNACVNVYSCGDRGENIQQALEFVFGKESFDCNDEEYKYFIEVLRDTKIYDYRC